MYYIYMMRCSDNSIYTGITTDINRRFKQHCGQVGGGAKYTKGRNPIAIEGAWQTENRSQASKLEYRIKHLSKEEKEALTRDPALLEKLMGEKLDCTPYSSIEPAPNKNKPNQSK